MILHFKTSNAKNLKEEIIKLIEDEELSTWSILERNGTKYLKHTQQWGDKGVIELTVDSKNEYLISEVLKYQNSKIEVKDFEGYYLGRFCEVIFVNFPGKFSLIEKK